MTPKELCVLIVKEPLVLIGLSSQKVIDIAQAYLNLESRIQKLTDALERIANYNNGVLDGIKLWSVIQIAKEALAELEQK